MPRTAVVSVPKEAVDHAFIWGVHSAAVKYSLWPTAVRRACTQRVATESKRQHYARLAKAEEVWRSDVPVDKRYEAIAHAAREGFESASLKFGFSIPTLSYWSHNLGSGYVKRIRQKGSPFERFMAKVQVRPNGCWEWLGRYDTKNDAVFSLGGGRQRMQARYYAYMVIKEMEMADEEWLVATCKNDNCVAPDHLISNMQLFQDDRLRRWLENPETP